MFCLLVIASVCFADVQSVEVSEPSTVSRWASVRVRNTKVVIQLSGDSIRGEYDAQRLSRACADGSCVLYHRWCESQADGWTCYYSTNENADYSRWLRITASDATSYAAAEKLIGVVSPTGQVVPLAALRTISPDPSPPYAGQKA